MALGGGTLLSEVAIGSRAEILHVGGLTASRLFDLGVRPGTTVEVVLRVPFVIRGSWSRMVSTAGGVPGMSLPDVFGVAGLQYTWSVRRPNHVRSSPAAGAGDCRPGPLQRTPGRHPVPVHPVLRTGSDGAADLISLPAKEVALGAFALTGEWSVAWVKPGHYRRPTCSHGLPSKAVATWA